MSILQDSARRDLLGINDQDSENQDQIEQDYDDVTPADKMN